MAFEFNQMSKKGQWGSVGALCAAAAGGFYMWVWSPNAEQLAVTQNEITTIQLENQRTRQVADQLPQLEAELEIMGAQLATLTNILPESQRTDQLLRRLEAAASESGLDLRGSTYLAPVLHDFYAEQPIELDLLGTFHDLARFFDRISKFGRVVTVGEVAIQAMTGPDAGSNTIQAQCTAATFFFLPEAETEVTDPGADPAAGR